MNESLNIFPSPVRAKLFIMGQSLVQNYVHIVFSIKKRQKLIDKEIESNLHSYLTTICSNQGCSPLCVGGYLDHVHILCNLSKNIAIQELVGELKKSSSKWIKTKGSKYASFYWQSGYGAFSVSVDSIERLKEYILNQELHHREKTFREEYIELLEESKVDYQLEYLFND